MRGSDRESGEAPSLLWVERTVGIRAWGWFELTCVKVGWGGVARWVIARAAGRGSEPIDLLGFVVFIERYYI